MSSSDYKAAIAPQNSLHIHIKNLAQTSHRDIYTRKRSLTYCTNHISLKVAKSSKRYSGHGARDPHK